MKSIGAAVLAIALLTLSSASASAQPPMLTNGTVQARAVTGGLDREFKALVAQTGEPAWIGYEVPIVSGDHQMCDYWSDGAQIRMGRLERGGPAGTQTTAAGTPRPVKLEGPTMFYVLYRVEQKRLDRVRIFSEDCAIDAGGRTLHWLTGVRPPESVALLNAFAGAPAEADRKLAESATAAIAMHADPAATEAMLRLARDHASARVRGNALFWLAQRAGQKAVGTITEAIDKDPDTEVKRRAVLALSQLPKDEGIPLLINVARTHSNPAVKKQAMFWLGQSKDPRALKFFEEILTK
jgi:hypothetical protein